MDASWQPDPTGRHQYRWWDGSRWTDSVADHGQTTTDPVSGPSTPSAAPPTVIAAPTPTPLPGAGVSSAGPPPGGPVFGAPGGPAIGGAPGTGSPLPGYTVGSPKSSGKGKWIALGVVVVAALVVVGILVFGGGGGGGSASGRSTVKLTDDVRVVTRAIKAKQGEVYRVRVEPPKGMDTRVTVLLTRTDARKMADRGVDFFSDVYTGGADDLLTDLFSDARDLVSDSLDSLDPDVALGYGFSLTNDGGTGEPDSDIIPALADVTFQVVIGAYDDGDNGTITVYVEKYDGDQLTDYSELDDLASDDPFFTDSGFYSDSEPYTPS